MSKLAPLLPHGDIVQEAAEEVSQESASGDRPGGQDWSRRSDLN